MLNMKQRLLNATFLLVATFLFASCNNNAASVQEEAHHHDQAATELALNNGQKWKSDVATSKNVDFLKTTVDNFTANEAPALSNYHTLGNDLGEGLNKMVKECKMSGPDHDALHVWMEPVLKQSNQLKTVADTSEAKLIYAALKQRIELYPQFFE